MSEAIGSTKNDGEEQTRRLCYRMCDMRCAVDRAKWVDEKAMRQALRNEPVKLRETTAKRLAKLCASANPVWD